MSELTEYKLKATIQMHILKIKSSEVVKAFVDRNERKSRHYAQLDREFLDYMFNEIEKLAKALVLCNATKTMELSKVHDYLLDQQDELEKFKDTIVDDAVKGISKRLDERREKMTAEQKQELKKSLGL